MALVHLVYEVAVQELRIFHIDKFHGSGSKQQFSGKERNGFSGGSNKVSSVSEPQSPRSEGDILQLSNLKSFTFNELRTATRNFRPDSVLGEGGFGSVFKGWVDEQTLAPARPGTGMVIAVKRLNHEGFQGHNEWLVSIFVLLLFLIIT